jgi:hypothetical protein
LSKLRKITSEIELRQAARELFGKQADVHWHWLTPEPEGERKTDAVVELTLDDRKAVFDVEFKLTPSARDLDRLVEWRKDRPQLLIAPSLSQLLVKHCRDHGINCADLNGRLSIRAKGLVIDRQPEEGRRYSPQLRAPDPFQGKSCRLVRAFLAHRERRWTQGELVEHTGLSPGLVSRLVQQLEREAILSKEGGRRGQGIRLNQFDALLDQWVRKDDWRKRSTVRQYSLLTSDLEEIARRLAKAFPSGGQLAFTQWFAANFRRPYTMPPVVSAYAANWLDEATEKELRARRVVDGGTLWLIVPKDEGVFRETQRVGEFVLVCDVQIYLDLLQVGLRGPDQAQALREWSGFGKTTA